MTHPCARIASLRVVVAIVVVACTAAGLVACTPPSRDLQAGSYRAVVDSPGGDLPFGLEVAKQAEGPALYLVNGDERVAATNLHTEPGKVSAVLPGGASTLTATISGGELRGEIAFATADGRARKLPFKAVLGQTWRFFEEPLTDNTDAAGRWAVTLTDDRHEQVRGVAELQQKFERVTGTLRTPGAERRVVGEVHGDQLLLSYFDGRTGQLLLARLNKTGALEGDVWTLPATHQRFAAARDPDAVLEEAPVAVGAEQAAAATQ